MTPQKHGLSIKMQDRIRAWEAACKLAGGKPPPLNILSLGLSKDELRQIAEGTPTMTILNRRTRVIHESEETSVKVTG
jgi:hypothetical protein